MWYNYFKDCWENGTVTEEQLNMAVERGYITESEKEEIMSNG